MIYRFASFELDDSTRELRGPTGPIETEPKAFELLLYLVRHRHRAVSKDELLEALWPRQIVTETALTRCVMKARRAIGDDANRQSAIRTVHGHGYRFIAELAPAPRPAPAPALGAGAGDAAGPAHARPSAAGHAGEPASRAKRIAGLAGAALAVLAAIGGWLYTRSDTGELADPGAVAVLPVTNLIDDPALAWVRVGLTSLMQRMLEDAGVDVVAERAVLDIVGDEARPGPPDEALLRRLREGAGAGTLLYTTLDAQGGLQRLSAVLTAPDGRRLRRMIVGSSPAELAADMARVVADIVSGAPTRPAGRFSKVSTDPFVNELYARALDLEFQGELEGARELFRYAADLEPEHFWLRYEIALCTRDLREWDEAARQFVALQEEARRGVDVRALIVALNSHGILELNRNDYDAAVALFDRALEAAAAPENAGERASIHTNLALVARRRGDIVAAQDEYEAALAAHVEAGETPSPNFDNNYAGLLLEVGDLEAAQRHSERAVAGFRLLGNRRFEAPSLNRLGRILRRRGDLEGAIARHDEAMAIYRELGDVGGEISVMSALTDVYLAKGDLTRARLNARDAVERAAATDDELLEADTRLQSARIEADLGNHAAAIGELEAARAMFAAIGDDMGLRSADSGLVLSALALGDAARAAAIAAALLETALAGGHESAAARARWLQGRIAAAGGDLAAAGEHYDAALVSARTRNDAGILADAGTSLADLELERRNRDVAAALIEEIRPVAAMSFDFQRLDARLALADGDTALAAEILTSLRVRAGEAWSDADDALLRSLQP